MIPTSIMSNKGDINIPKLVRTVINHLIPIMQKIELHICLAKGARLNIGVSHSRVITNEVVQNLMNSPKLYLIFWQWLNLGNGHI